MKSIQVKSAITNGKQFTFKTDCEEWHDDLIRTTKKDNVYMVRLDWSGEFEDFFDALQSSFEGVNLPFAKTHKKGAIFSEWRYYLFVYSKEAPKLSAGDDFKVRFKLNGEYINSFLQNKYEEQPQCADCVV